METHFFIILCILLPIYANFTEVQLPPKIITSHPTTTYIRVLGLNFTLPCVTTGASRISWWKDGRQVDDRVVTSDGSLALFSLSAYDMGIYHCRAHNRLGVAMSNSTHLVRALHNTYTAVGVQKEVAILGQPYRMNVTLAITSPSCSYLWRSCTSVKDVDGPLIRNTRRVHTSIRGDLYFSHILPEDTLNQSIYKAFSLNEYMDSSLGVSYIDLDVIDAAFHDFAPYLMTSSPIKNTAIIGSNYTLRCFFASFPLADYKWYKKTSAKKELTSNHSIEGDGTILVLMDVQIEDGGDYVCEGKNLAGQDSVVFNVRVGAPPSFNTPFSYPTDTSVTESDPIIIRCDPSSLPPAHVMWFINDVPYSEASLSNRWILSHDKRLLTIHNTSRASDPCVIHCNASNLHGYVLVAGYIHVLKKSIIKISGSNQKTIITNVNDERELIYHCEAEIDPTTSGQVRWYKKNAPKDEDSHDMFEWFFGVIKRIFASYYGDGGGGSVNGGYYLLSNDKNDGEGGSNVTNENKGGDEEEKEKVGKNGIKDTSPSPAQQMFTVGSHSAQQHATFNNNNNSRNTQTSNQGIIYQGLYERLYHENHGNNAPQLQQSQQLLLQHNNLEENQHKTNNQQKLQKDKTQSPQQQKDENQHQQLHHPPHHSHHKHIHIDHHNNLILKRFKNSPHTWRHLAGSYKCLVDNGHTEVSKVVEVIVNPPAESKSSQMRRHWWLMLLLIAPMLCAICGVCCCCCGCCCRRCKGDKQDIYDVDEHERHCGKDPLKELINNGFNQYSRTTSNKEPLSTSRSSSASNDSWMIYAVDSLYNFNEDGSFVGAYTSGGRDISGINGVGGRGEGMVNGVKNGRVYNNSNGFVVWDTDNKNNSDVAYNNNKNNNINSGLFINNNNTGLCRIPSIAYSDNRLDGEGWRDGGGYNDGGVGGWGVGGLNGGANLLNKGGCIGNNNDDEYKGFNNNNKNSNGKYKRQYSSLGVDTECGVKLLSPIDDDGDHHEKYQLNTLGINPWSGYPVNKNGGLSSNHNNVEKINNNNNNISEYNVNNNNNEDDNVYHTPLLPPLRVTSPVIEC